MVRERPILFSAPMVRALLAGTKTQTRRIIALPRKRVAFVMVGDEDGSSWWPYQSDDGESQICSDGCEHPYESPFGHPYDRLWVREAWRAERVDDARPPRDLDSGCRVWFEADGSAHDAGDVAVDAKPGRLRPGMFMPRWASRILLEVTELRVERLQDISESDAVAEGVYTDPACPAYDGYATLWDQINGAGAWQANPWVWAVSFKDVTA